MVTTIFRWLSRLQAWVDEPRSRPRSSRSWTSLRRTSRQRDRHLPPAPPHQTPRHHRIIGASVSARTRRRRRRPVIGRPAAGTPRTSSSRTLRTDHSQGQGAGHDQDQGLPRGARLRIMEDPHPWEDRLRCWRERRGIRVDHGRRGSVRLIRRPRRQVSLPIDRREACGCNPDAGFGLDNSRTCLA